ncbi:ZIP zinc transporter-domain-containing protein [Halteromyces radiatus]|uniref:ZIP zinc transporter-domain-containing protein n=1 Tax=Halteromyces radiatus TaxID=101107 RepID=UPI0022206D38|nr:ZIP zinc transporter-domain-containing protein [Halteromyces radiatus]KAI8098651.1 ZIP zinc transporter-domain-containing protein [Halteromyces radiatus]
MLNPFIWLLLLSITMLIGSFVFGCIPLATKLSSTKLRQLTAIGVGLLIGTSLVVIIPEGVETLYSSPVPSTTLANNLSHNGMMETPTSSANTYVPMALSPWSTTSTTTTTTATTKPSSHYTIEDPNHPQADITTDQHDHHEDATPKHTSVGWALILGFGVMFVIDQFSSLHVHGNNGRLEHDHELDSMLATTSTKRSAKDDDLDDNDKDDDQVDDQVEERWNNNNHSISANHAQSMTPTIGLMVHAAADGIALGASASHPQLSMVVFFAIMLHKGPSAFALTTVLLAEGFSRLQVRKHLLLFSMAAPTGALVTYLLLSLTSPGDMALEYWTGVLLLFSGGTFLYVAMHALQELQPSHHHDKLERSHIFCILFGMFLPVVLNLGHSH